MYLKPAVIALLATSVAAKNPGLGGSITQEGLTNGKNILTPFLFQYLKDIQIPEIDIKGGKFTNLDIHIPQPALSNINIGLHNDSNSLEMNAQGIQATTTADFSFKYIITVSGSANIQIKKMNIDAQLGISTQPSANSSELAPKLSVQKMDIDINPDDIDI